jgi:hypothetical protein
MLTTDDDQLMLEDQGFCGRGARAARTQKPRQGDEQMDPQNHKIAHASNRTTLEIQRAGWCNGARWGYTL